ncbi:hypothetical protein ACPCT8_14285 [Aeromonas media]|uniref:hypothetical protein n=1 Tax=Aeromonas TaxID=642 RepID=UPI000F7B08AA|nr:MULTISPECIES: hypothetical protein [Aeromonas]MDM5122011.1 hypothetical protein [Aeromonas rivipollensis]RSM29541.1 hypothetical protein C5B78_07900 [Aeromonas salmonicida]
MVTTDDELEYYRRLFAIYERNKAREKPSTRKLFREIERELVEPLGGFVKCVGQFNYLVKHRNEMGGSYLNSLGFHPMAYRLATAIGFEKSRQQERARRPRMKSPNPLKVLVYTLVAERPDISFESLKKELKSNHCGPEKLIEFIDKNKDNGIVQLNEFDNPVSFKTITGWITACRKNLEKNSE